MTSQANHRLIEVAPRTLSRRSVLRGLGTIVALPWLEAMRPTRLLTAAERPVELPLRMGFIYVPNGKHMAEWTPTIDGVGYEMPRTLGIVERHREDFNLLSGLTLDGAFAHGDGPGDHARSVASFLTGAHPYKTDGADIRNGVSIDQVVAQAVGSKTRFASLELGLEPSAGAGRCDSGYSCVYTSNLSWRTPTSPMAKEIDPGGVFDRLFGDRTTRDSVQVKNIRDKYRMSVLDFVLEDAQQLNRRLGAEDRRKLDEYLYSVRDVEKRLVGSEKLRLGEDGVPDYPRPAGIPRKMKDHGELMLDMMTLALQTDSTRVVTFMVANAGSNRGYPEVGVAEGHHDCSHHGKSQEKQQKVATIDRFHVGLFGYLLDRMSQVREGERTLLDNSMIVYGSGISDGDRHNHDDLPVVIAGQAGGRLTTGRHVRYPNRTPLCNLYLWMARQMGLEASSFGDSTEPLPNLSRNS